MQFIHDWICCNKVSEGISRVIYRELASVKFTNCGDKMSPFMMHPARVAYIKAPHGKLCKNKAFTGLPSCLCLQCQQNQGFMER